MSNFDCFALTWLNGALASLSQQGMDNTMNNYPARLPEENVIETENGPLVVPDSVKRLQTLLACHESGLLEPGEWLDSVQGIKSGFIRSLVALELKLIPELQPYQEGKKFDIGFRKGGVIVWREKPRALSV